MTPFDAYVMYLALKQHFNNKTYDYIQYNGKVRANKTTFETRKDKYFFYKLSKKKNPEEYVIANFLIDPNIWIGNLVNDKENEEVYNAYKRRQESLSYIFKNDLQNLDSPLDINLIVSDNETPILLKKFYHGDITIETMVILNKLCNFIPYWNKKIQDKVIWPENEMRIMKFTPFVKFDEQKFRQITLDYFSEPK